MEVWEFGKHKERVRPRGSLLSVFAYLLVILAILLLIAAVGASAVEKMELAEKSPYEKFDPFLKTAAIPMSMTLALLGMACGAVGFVQAVTTQGASFYGKLLAARGIVFGIAYWVVYAVMKTMVLK